MPKKKCTSPSKDEREWSNSLRFLDFFFEEVMEKKKTGLSGDILQDVQELEEDIYCSRFDYRKRRDRERIVDKINAWKITCEREQKRGKDINCSSFAEVIDALSDNWNCNLERTAGKIIDAGNRRATRCSYFLTDDELRRLEEGSKSVVRQSIPLTITGTLRDVIEPVLSFFDGLSTALRGERS